MTTDLTRCWRTSPDLLNISWRLLSWYSISANITLFLIRSIDGHWIVWFEAHKQFELIWSSYCHFLRFHLIPDLDSTHCWYNSSGWISKDQKSHYVWIVSTQSRRPDLRRLGKVLLAQLTPLGFVPASLEIYMGRGDELTGFNWTKIGWKSSLCQPVLICFVHHSSTPSTSVFTIGSFLTSLIRRKLRVMSCQLKLIPPWQSHTQVSK